MRVLLYSRLYVCVYVCYFYLHIILVLRTYDPSRLRQESRALGATISGMRHRCRLLETGCAE